MRYFQTLSLLTLASLALASCKAKRSDSDLESVDPVLVSKEPSAHGVTFEQFDYDVDATSLKELGSRIGCDEAARWLSVPSSGSLTRSISSVLKSETVYQTLQAEFFDREKIRKKCLEGGAPPKKAMSDGLNEMLRYVQKTYPNDGLTIVMVGGFGSHLGPVRSLDQSMAEWGKIIERQPSPVLRVWQIECSNSFAVEDRCAKELLDSLSAKERNEPALMKHHYLLWGFSKGGNTSLEALRLSKELRDKTLALVTMGSPISGSMTMLMLDPVVQKIASTVSSLTTPLSEYAKKLPLQYLMTPASYLIDQTSQPIQIAALMAPKELEQVSQGSKAMLPQARKDYVYNTLKVADYSRSDGTPIPVYHGIALADLGDFKPVPLLTLKEGRLTWKENSHNSDHLAEMGFGAMLKDFPLGDTCVAMQHAVIPKDAVPKGLKPEVFALMTFDHGSLRFTPLEGASSEVPNVAVVDALVSSLAVKMQKGGAQ